MAAAAAMEKAARAPAVTAAAASCTAWATSTPHTPQQASSRCLLRLQSLSHMLPVWRRPRRTTWCQPAAAAPARPSPQ
eukprot:scaffold84163_cov14-Tisochrysis_lutea.AAC.1